MQLTRACFGFFAIQNSFALNPSDWRYIFPFMFMLETFKAQKILILNVNGVFCYFLQFAILQGNAWVFKINIHKSKVEVRARMKHFLLHAFKKFYIAIWSCMKLEDVLKVLPMLILDTFMDYSIFIWGCKQCSKTSGQFFPRSYYYLKDLKWVYSTCCGLLYGKEDQTLLIDDEPSKTFWNPNWSDFFLESLKGELLSKNKVQLLDLAFHLWPTLIKLHSMSIIWDHYDVLVKYSKPCLNTSSHNYSWFMQYMNYDNGNLINA